MVHVNDAVVDGRVVFLLLAKVKPALDTDFKCIEDFCPVPEVPHNSDFDVGDFFLDESQHVSHFHCKRAFCPKKDGHHATVHLDDIEQLGEVLWGRDFLFLGDLDFVQILVVGFVGEDVEMQVA